VCLTLLTKQSGESLATQIDQTAAVSAHTGIAISVAQTLVAVFAIVATVIVGDTGARAVWSA